MFWCDTNSPLSRVGGTSSRVGGTSSRVVSFGVARGNDRIHCFSVVRATWSESKGNVQIPIGIFWLLLDNVRFVRNPVNEGWSVARSVAHDNGYYSWEIVVSFKISNSCQFLNMQTQTTLFQKDQVLSLHRLTFDISGQVYFQEKLQTSSRVTV